MCYSAGGDKLLTQKEGLILKENVSYSKVTEKEIERILKKGSLNFGSLSSTELELLTENNEVALRG